MVLVVFCLLALYYWMNWIGYLFALKYADHFAKSCKDVWFFHALATAFSTWFTFVVYRGGSDAASDPGIQVVMCIWVLYTLCGVVPQITSAVAKFHNKQKAKRS